MLFAVDQFFEDRKYLFAVRVDALKVVAKTRLESGSLHPFLDKRLRNIDVAPERINRVAAQK